MLNKTMNRIYQGRVSKVEIPSDKEPVATVPKLARHPLAAPRIDSGRGKFLNDKSSL